MSLVVHIGIPKSGTTFLQTQVFDKTEGLHCIGRPHHGTDAYRRFYHAVMHEEDEHSAVEAIRHFVQEKTGGKTLYPFILSDEAFAFAPLWHV